MNTINKEFASNLYMIHQKLGIKKSEGTNRSKQQKRRKSHKEKIKAGKSMTKVEQQVFNEKLTNRLEKIRSMKKKDIGINIACEYRDILMTAMFYC